ncbi:MAG: 1,6-anhydro-N-acetylmuramyl-L-alanine amidase AmpD [Gammaproteobacteria bacterium]|nr:1,6-anhydro-N-acetylmuramyl-L-alanine amidase AmpD [Gammaproteobacteria bacterium]
MVYDAATGWFRGCRQVRSPNCNARPRGIVVDLVVIHGISLPPGCFGSGDVERLFTNTLDCAARPEYAALRDLRVSAHLLIERQGTLTQFVALPERAWHAGVSSFRGRPDCNDFAIGIELEGCDDIPYTTAQYAALGAVLAALRDAFPEITRERIVGHSEVAPQRKTDPGPAFDWTRLRAMLEGE